MTDTSRPVKARSLLLPLALALLLVVGISVSGVGGAAADHTGSPATVTIAGDLQSELGCPEDWQPDCAATTLTRHPADGVWRATFAVPAGTWQYKAALNGGWEENYGAAAEADGANIVLTLDEPAAVTFYYDHGTHWVTDNHSTVIATVPGDFQTELGCDSDWDPRLPRHVAPGPRRQRHLPVRDHGSATGHLPGQGRHR